MCFCVLLYFTACMLYYCKMVGWAWWDWGLIWWLTILLQCFDTVGWVTWPVNISSPNDLYCVEWDVKPYSTQLKVYMMFFSARCVIVIERIVALLPWCSSVSVCQSVRLGTDVHCDHTVHFSADLSLWLHSSMFWAPWYQSKSTYSQPSFSKMWGIGVQTKHRIKRY